MEFQAYKVLVIACDMRQIITSNTLQRQISSMKRLGTRRLSLIANTLNYLQRFGEVGAKAMSSKKDFELYEAIRHLSILKELPNGDPKEIEEATKLVEERQRNLEPPQKWRACPGSTGGQSRIWANRDRGEAQDLRRRVAFLHWGIRFVFGGKREEDPLLDRRG
jgi:hypothetical protein